MLSFTFFDSAEWTTDSVSKELYSKLEKERNELINEQIQDRGYIVKLENENKVLKARLKDAPGIDYISQLHKNVLNQRKELRNLNKVLERERKRNKELEELYSGSQSSVAMLNMKVMELNQGIRDSADLTWKEKYDKLAKECEMYRRIALRNKKENHDKDVAFSKIVNIIDETVTKKEE